VPRTTELAAELGVEPVIADFADLDQVRRLAGVLLDRCPRIDVLANNAGGLFSERVITVDGHETNFQVNHLAPFLLTTLLLPRLVENAQQAPVRVVATSSIGNRFGKVRLDDLEWEQRPWRGGWFAYSTGKLMNVLFTRQLARRTAGTGIEAFSFHPGGIASNFGSGSTIIKVVNRTLRRTLHTVDQGAEPLIWLASSPEVAGLSGTYFDRFTRNGKVNPQADDPNAATRLWEESTRLVTADAQDSSR
jgi:NAD(P)-dependent dehydrogenase (short-subunit alcohol dehydrogenase family)